MSTLVLGHGRSYAKNNIYCSSYDVNEWYDNIYICVDIDPSVKPDIIYDLNKPKWSFCKNNKYDKIIDTTGCVFYRSNVLGKKHYQYGYENKIFNILNINGEFYGRDGTHWIKIDDDKIKIIVQGGSVFTQEMSILG